MHGPFHLKLAAATALAVLAASSHAEVTLNAGARLSHDSNVNGSPDLPTKANQRSDSFLALSASAVYFTPLNREQTDYFVGQVGALVSRYNNFSNLDSSTLMGSAGFYRQFSPKWSGQLTGRAFVRETRQHDRDSSGYGATAEIKRQLTQTVWLKGVADYEDNRANLSTFSSTGPTYAVSLGYLPNKDRFINLGFSHASRDFKSTTPFNTKSKTWFLEGTEKVSKNWYLSLGYAFQDNDSNFAGTAYTSHIVSAGLSFSY
ncbi:hypothetical protein [Lacisediminimonas profundi]|uniref:hypothetical protein n=1 Tax=Lacisediminimonas profundi TaxID=2603856 RepID=UPI00124B5AD7|nr:hypothetical protein [Lacisediminimonas profundi]